LYFLEFCKSNKTIMWRTISNTCFCITNLSSINK